jgi:anti-sigma regulatory factor (Ser/Thr protein kinase)
MKPVPIWSYECRLAAELGSAGRVRDFVSTHLIAHQLGALVQDVELVASELATNAVIHARTAFAVTLSGTDEGVLLSVCDGSVAMPVGTVPAALQSNGRGLTIVAAFSSAWGVVADDCGSKSIWATFATPASEAHDLAESATAAPTGRGVLDATQSSRL